MSYILEAIKRLELKRQQEGSPNILTPQDTIVHVRRKRLLWPYAVAGTILLNGVTALSLIWVLPSRQTEPYPEPVPLSMPAESKEPEQAVGQKESPPPPQKKASQPDAATPETRLDLEAPPKSPPAKAHRAPPPSSPLKAAPGITARVRKPAPSNKSVITAMQNLPEILRNSLPELKMTVHFYDEQPQLRFAIINDRNLKEGQLLRPELKLERITPEGAVFNYYGHQFLLGIH